MIQRALEIVLSSTSKDLKKYRDKVGEVIARMRQVAIRMETGGAKPRPPRRLPPR